MLSKNPVILLSIVNTKLRDKYNSLDELCLDLNENKEEIVNILKQIGFIYSSEHNQFKINS